MPQSSSLPTRRLIDATASLGPADRALLNLWVNRGLGDERLSALTGISAEKLEARRTQIVQRLSATLGLPLGHVHAALSQIAAGSRAPGAGSANGQAPSSGGGEQSSPNGHVAPVESTDSAVPSASPKGVHTNVSAIAPGRFAGPAAAQAAAPATPAATGQPAATASVPVSASPNPSLTEPERSDGRRRGVLIAIDVLLAALIVVAIVLLSAGSAKHRAVRAASATTPTTPPAITPTSASPTPAPPTRAAAGGPIRDTLGGLPGGLTSVHGTLQLAGPVKQPTLELRVTGLVAALGGHYEVWLYNSIIDSQPLGQLRAGIETASYELPADARRYRWIDVSLQPLGVVNHSGESEVRATNPAHRARARLRRPSARKPDRLRSAATGSTIPRRAGSR